MQDSFVYASLHDERQLCWLEEWREYYFLQESQETCLRCARREEGKFALGKVDVVLSARVKSVRGKF